jgi:hypothetical protein
MMQTDLLRGNWSFEGYVVGDSDTVKFIHTKHNYTASDPPSSTASISLGFSFSFFSLDLKCQRRMPRAFAVLPRILVAAICCSHGSGRLNKIVPSSDRKKADVLTF